MPSTSFFETGTRSTFVFQRIRVNGCGGVTATAVCWALPPNPAHSTEGAGAFTRAIDAGAEGHELKITATDAIAPVMALISGLMYVLTRSRQPRCGTRTVRCGARASGRATQPAQIFLPWYLFYFLGERFARVPSAVAAIGASSSTWPRSLPCLSTWRACRSASSPERSSRPTPSGRNWRSPCIPGQSRR